MNKAQDIKVVALNADLTKDNGNFSTTPVDTKGFRNAQVVLHFGDVPANVAAIKLTECDTVNGSYADIAGTVVGTALDIDGNATVLPTAAAGDGAVLIFDIDLRGRKRFLDLVATAGNGAGSATEMSALVLLSRAEIAPTTVAGRGAADVLRV